MNCIKGIINFGIKDSLSEHEKRGGRVLNSINFLTILILMTMSIILNVMDFSVQNVVIAFSIQLIMIIPLIINSLGKTIFSRVAFILLAYFVIFATSMIYGGATHFQYFIVLGISLPLIFFDQEIFYYKWLLVFLAMPLGLYQEWHFLVYKPLIEVSIHAIYWIRLFSDILLFLTILVILFVFTTQYYKQFRAIENSNLKLQQNNLELNQFAYIISHDLKAPLRLINSLVDIIVYDYQDEFDEDLNNNFELIKSSVTKMDKLILSVLEYSKAGRDGVEISTFNTVDLFNDVVSILNPPEYLRVLLPKNKIFINGSYAQLHQVFINLLENAIKYHDKEDGFVKITFSEESKGVIQFKVEDNGPGIKYHFHNKLLQIFQTGNENQEIESTGIGLAIVKKLVEQNSGKLIFDSVYGEGSTFSFSWPININKPLELL